MRRLAALLLLAAVAATAGCGRVGPPVRHSSAPPPASTGAAVETPGTGAAVETPGTGATDEEEAK